MPSPFRAGRSHMSVCGSCAAFLRKGRASSGADFVLAGLSRWSYWRNGIRRIASARPTRGTPVSFGCVSDAGRARASYAYGALKMRPHDTACKIGIVFHCSETMSPLPQLPAMRIALLAGLDGARADRQDPLLIPKPGKPDFGRRRGGAISLLTSHAIALTYGRWSARAADAHMRSPWQARA